MFLIIDDDESSLNLDVRASRLSWSDDALYHGFSPLRSSDLNPNMTHTNVVVCPFRPSELRAQLYSSKIHQVCGPSILCSSFFNCFMLFLLDLEVGCPIAACSCVCAVLRHVSSCAVDRPPCLPRLSAVTLVVRVSLLEKA